MPLPSTPVRDATPTGRGSVPSSFSRGSIAAVGAGMTVEAGGLAPVPEVAVHAASDGQAAVASAPSTPGSDASPVLVPYSLGKRSFMF